MKTSGWLCFRKCSYSVIRFVKHVAIGLCMHGQWNPRICVPCPSLEAGTLTRSLRCSHPWWKGPLQNAAPGECLHVLIILSSANVLEGPWMTPPPPKVCGAYNYSAAYVSITFFDSSPPGQVWKLRHLGVSGGSVAEPGRNTDLLTASPLNHEPLWVGSMLSSPPNIS